jgi:hypothetical protein
MCMLADVKESPIYFCVPDCWLEVNIHPEGPAAGHLDAGFPGFLLFLSKCSDGYQVPSWFCELLMQPYGLKFVRIQAHRCQNHHLYFFQTIQFDITSEKQNSTAPVSNH